MVQVHVFFFPVRRKFRELCIKVLTRASADVYVCDVTRRVIIKFETDDEKRERSTAKFREEISTHFELQQKRVSRAFGKREQLVKNRTRQL